MIKANEYVIAKETGNGFKFVEFMASGNRHSLTDNVAEARRYKTPTDAVMVMTLLELNDYSIYTLTGTELSITL